MNSAVSHVKPLVAAYLDQSIGYAGLGDAQKSIIDSISSSFDAEFFNQFDGDASKMYQAIENMIQNIKTSGIDEEYNLILNAKTLFNGDELSLGEYKTQIDSFISKIDDLKTDGYLNDNDVKYIKISLGIDESGTDVHTFSNYVDSLFGNLTDDIKSNISQLTYSDLQVINSDVFNVEPGTLSSWDELMVKIEEAKIALTEDFDITNFTDAISNHSAVISEYQEAIQKLDKGSFTMDDFMELIKKYPDLAKGVDISSNAFYGLSRNLNRAIKTSTKSFIRDLKELRVSLVAAGKSTDSIDQLIEAIENMPDDALDDIIEKYSTLADKINKAKLAQDKLTASMEENPNEGYETHGEAMEYMKEAMAKGEIGSESNLWNVAEKYGFTYDSAKTINENADALAKFIATRERWFKTSDDGDDRTKDDGYSYEGTENFIEDVESAVKNNAELQQYLTWDYDENAGTLNFDFKNKNWDTIVSMLSKTKELAGLTSDEFSDLMIQVGQYFGINWGNYDDAVDHLNEIANGTDDAKTKTEEYGKYMQEYFGKNTEIDLTARPMVSSEEMQEAGWTEFEAGDYATLYSGSYNSDDDSVTVSVTPILPDGAVLDPKSLEKYATEIANGTDPAEVEIVYKGKKYTGDDIFLNKFEGTNMEGLTKEEQASQYGTKLSEAQAGYDQLRDTLGINVTLNEKGIDGLKEISELQDIVETNSKGVTVIDEEAFTTALEEANYTEDQIDIIIEKIKTLNSEAFNVDPFKIDETIINNGVAGLEKIEEIKASLTKDDTTGLTVFDTDMFTVLLQEAGYTETQIDSLIKKIQEYNNIVSVSGNTDPLGLNNASFSIESLKASLSTLGIEFDEGIGKWFDGKKTLTINVTDLVTTLKEKGWTDESIKTYITQLANDTNLDGFNVKVKGIENIDEVIKTANEVPKEKETEYEVTGDGAKTVDNIRDDWAHVPTTKKTTYEIDETTTKKTVYEEEKEDENKWWNPFTWGAADGTAHVSGTAYSGGSWGAPNTGTALTGELGPEMVVRNGRWFTVGENGAEFTQIKRGDIIFNHKQTESLLKNGYVTSRGKAYASGTAYADGYGTFASYVFSGSGGYEKVNGNVVDSWGDLSGAVGDAADAADEFAETIDWIEIRIEELDEVLGLLGAQLENTTGAARKNDLIDEIIGVNKQKYVNALAGSDYYAGYVSQYWNKIPQEYREFANNGEIAVSDFAGEANEAVVEAINKYREYAQKAADLTQQAEETITEIRDLAIQRIDNAYQSGEVRATVENNQTEKLQNRVDLDEEMGLITSDAYYTAMMENSNRKIKYWTQAREQMQEEFDTAVKNGEIIRGSNEWYEMIDQLYQVDAEIAEATIELEEFQNAINDIYWDNFDVLISRLDYLTEETQSLIDLMDNEDMVADPVKKMFEGGTKEYWTVDDVKWTDEGLASLGLYAQQMEIAEYEAKQYAEAIDDLTRDYKDGKYSENEYYEKLEELTSAQYDSIEAYHEAQDAIVELNEARIDMIKDGIEKEIDAYSELIEKKKEELDAEKDLHDFQKGVMDQQKNIAEIERKLAALSSDNSASARAKRAQLESDLAEALYELNESYYDRSVQDQQDALDEELDGFKQTKDEEILKWEEYLTNVELIVADSLNMIQANASGIYDTLSSKAQEYDLTVSDAIMSPWRDGELAVSDYQDTFDTAMSSTMDQLEELKEAWQEVIDKMAEVGEATVDTFNEQNERYTEADNERDIREEGKKNKNNPTFNRPVVDDPVEQPTQEQPDLSYGSSVVVKSSATHFGSKSGGLRMASFVPGGTYTVYGTSGDQVLIGLNGAYTGWVNKYDIEGYAKGTISAANSGIVNVDELGEELIIRAKNGRLTYMEKGSGVVPADLTSNLMQWGKLDPTSMIEQNRPSIAAPIVQNKEVNIDLTYGDILHIEEFHGDNPEDIAKIVAKQFEKHTRDLNNAIKRYTR